MPLYDAEIVGKDLTPLVLQGPRVYLCSIRDEDLPLYAKVFSDGTTMQHLAHLAKAESGGWTLQQMSERHAEKSAIMRKGEGIFFGVYCHKRILAAMNEENTTLMEELRCPMSSCGAGVEMADYYFAGPAGLNWIDHTSHSASAGIVVHRFLQRTHLASEVLWLIFDYAFQHLGIESITMDTSENNTPMRRWCENVANMQHTKTQNEDAGVWMEYTLSKRQWLDYEGHEGTRTKMMKQLQQRAAVDMNARVVNGDHRFQYLLHDL
ncbi:hypothetical protein BC832DRAFT_591558 [Gaertneriomyces semiglobifer]|nr:hypothetical protein BC832DRAFT_591558 [Gaertneriomyces semiglobifer]